VSSTAANGDVSAIIAMVSTGELSVLNDKIA